MFLRRILCVLISWTLMGEVAGKTLPLDTGALRSGEPVSEDPLSIRAVSSRAKHQSNDPPVEHQGEPTDDLSPRLIISYLPAAFNFESNDCIKVCQTRSHEGSCVIDDSCCSETYSGAAYLQCVVGS
ncbi:uncharacterized protein [Macrobrachium rosenbergii]|uniref:uncharacterized protein n=1 Tax=Macrobrachium rosenbergii TaxID=79674 RepID=UPI0034D61867